MALNFETLKSTRRARHTALVGVLRELGISVLLVAAGVQMWWPYVTL